MPETTIAGSEIKLAHVNIEVAGTGAKSEVFSIASIARGFTSVAIPVRITSDIIHIQAIPEATPRLFCDFPLVGTELFPFPAIINSPHFDPTDSRDGVFLTRDQRPNPLVENNRQIVTDAVALFKQLMDFAVSNNWQNLHHLANITPLRAPQKWIADNWFNEMVLEPVRQVLLKALIVSTASGGALAAMLTEDQTIGVWFPAGGTKSVREKIWRLASRWFPHALPRQDEVELWRQLIWDKCGRLTSTQFAKFVTNVGSTVALAKELPGMDCTEWLNEFYAMIHSDETNCDSIINGEAIFPNQHGVFCKNESLYRDSGDIDDELKDIIGLLGHDIRERLAANNISVDIPTERTIDRHFVVEKISSIAMDKSNDRSTSKACRIPFERILMWFRANPVLAQQLFPALYNRKHVLYDDDSITENMDKAEQLDGLMSETGATTIEELRRLVQKGSRAFLPVTQEILASMGISSIEDWENAIRDKDLAALFSHRSISTTEMFLVAQQLISRAKASIRTHLATLSNYDLANVEETAPTVLGGIRKDGREIHVVARPAYSQEVIIYYTAEQDVLDFEDSELWVDTGAKQMRVTLGHILKTTDIKKFPI